jgi:glucokinase
LTGAIELDLRTQLEKEMGHEIDVENDATCAAHAEWQFGAGRGATDMWMVTLGTGIGGGFVSGSKLQRGSHGFAGEIGHMVVESQGILCKCGQRGCWERYASGSGLATIAGGERGEEVIARAAGGDKQAIGYLDTFGRWVAIGLVNLTNITDPNVIVIGGGLAEAADLVMPHIKTWFKQLLYAPDNREHPELRVAQLGEHAGAIGAALLSAGV